MSDLTELREQLHLSVERVIGAAAIAEIDNEAMRSAIIDALGIHREAEALCDDVREPIDRLGVRAEALEAIVDRLQALQAPGLAAARAQIEADEELEP